MGSCVSFYSARDQYRPRSSLVTLQLLGTGRYYIRWHLGIHRSHTSFYFHTHTQTQTCWNRLIFVLILMLSVSKAVGVARVSDLLYIFHVVLGVPLSLRVPFVLIVNVTFCLPFLRCVFDVICSDQRRSRICSTCYHFFYIYYDNDWGIQGRRGKVLNGRPSCRSSSCLFNRIVVDVSFFLSSF